MFKQPILSFLFIVHHGGSGSATRPRSEGWGRGEIPQRPNRRTTPQGLDQR